MSTSFIFFLFGGSQEIKFGALLRQVKCFCFSGRGYFLSVSLHGLQEHCYIEPIFGFTNAAGTMQFATRSAPKHRILP